VIGFGLDPAAYTEGRTVLAVAERKGQEANIYLLRGCPFSRRPDSDGEIAGILAGEQTELRRLLGLHCRIAIDVPIDLQGLPKINSPRHSWQFTRRAVDVAVGGAAPLASFLGHITARFQVILDSSDFQDEIGKKIFETYPKPTLKRLAKEQWQQVKGYKKEAKQLELLCKIINIASVVAVKTDDDLDAAVCALTAVASPNELWTVDDYKRGDHALSASELPQGYRLLACNPFDRINVSCAPYEDWMKLFAYRHDL
jgi:hypothetical protein